LNNILNVIIAVCGTVECNTGDVAIYYIFQQFIIALFYLKKFQHTGYTVIIKFTLLYDLDMWMVA